MGYISLPLLVCVIDALGFAYASPEAKPLFKDAFWVGLLVALYIVSAHYVRF